VISLKFYPAVETGDEHGKFVFYMIPKKEPISGPNKPETGHIETVENVRL